MKTEIRDYNCIEIINNAFLSFIEFGFKNGENDINVKVKLNRDNIPILIEALTRLENAEFIYNPKGKIQILDYENTNLR